MEVALLLWVKRCLMGCAIIERFFLQEACMKPAVDFPPGKDNVLQSFFATVLIAVNAHPYSANAIFSSK
ncbi:hypothetical protein [Polaromonas sp.]|uniref:hypothetical protein n=1 Tax=Polaromonas sp. TaxID=1869339 RepID=UPI0013B93FDE|nr:hypothetical protein [Polaromonas sp.]NDP64033.1 hypothetical protein [Polaromonas sp.]